MNARRILIVVAVLLLFSGAGVSALAVLDVIEVGKGMEAFGRISGVVAVFALAMLGILGALGRTGAKPPDEEAPH